MPAPGGGQGLRAIEGIMAAFDAGQRQKEARRAQSFAETSFQDQLERQKAADASLDLDRSENRKIAASQFRADEAANIIAAERDVREEAAADENRKMSIASIQLDNFDKFGTPLPGSTRVDGDPNVLDWDHPITGPGRYNRVQQEEEALQLEIDKAGGTAQNRIIELVIDGEQTGPLFQNPVTNTLANVDGTPFVFPPNATSVNIFDPDDANREPVEMNVNGVPSTVLIDPKGRFYSLSDPNTLLTGRILTTFTGTDAATLSDVNSLNAQWQKATEEINALGQDLIIMEEGLIAARAGDMNTGSQAILVTFQKFLDPTSVVRESEYARSAQGLAMYSRLIGIRDRLEVGGAQVPLSELEGFVDLAREINEGLSATLGDGRNKILADERTRIENVADKYNIEHDLIFGSERVARTVSETSIGNMP